MRLPVRSPRLALVGAEAEGSSVVKRAVEWLGVVALGAAAGLAVSGIGFVVLALLGRLPG